MGKGQPLIVRGSLDDCFPLRSLPPSAGFEWNVTVGKCGGVGLAYLLITSVFWMSR